MSIIRAITPSFIKNKLKKNQILFDYLSNGPDIWGFQFKGDDIRKDISERYNYSGDIVDIYVEGSDRLVTKWHHYLPIYDRYFAAWRGGKVRFLEIGVSEGGSLAMWRKYFGGEAVIYGVDINEACRAFDGVDGQVRIGSQDDPAFLAGVVEEMGGVDVVLDDGSHVMGHIRASLEALFPRLSDGGVYMIEDLHTAYWPSHQGGFYRRANFFNYIRNMVDDMHRWYHVSPMRHPTISPYCSGIHLHDSICVFEKSAPRRPTHSRVRASS
jgi:hypothetical protein